MKLSQNTCAVILALSLFVVGASANQARSGDALSQKDQNWGSKGTYTVYAFYKDGSLEGIELKNRMADLAKKFDGRAQVDLVGTSSPDFQELSTKYSVISLPSVVVVSNGGVVTGGVRGIPEIEDIERALVPPKMTEIISAIQNNKIVLLVIGRNGIKEDESTTKSVNNFQRVFKKSVKSLRLDASLPEEMEVSRNLGVDASNLRSVKIVMLSANGVVDVFSPPVSTRDLIGSFQKVLLSKSGCGGSNEGGLKSSCQE